MARIPLAVSHAERVASALTSTKTRRLKRYLMVSE